MHNMNRQHKKISPKVRNGIVQRKNNWTNTSTYWNTEQKSLVIDKEPAGHGYKHFLRKRDIKLFISILPDWKELTKGLNAIVLSRGDAWALGYHHKQGVIELCAWDRNMWLQCDKEWYEEHQEILEKLHVPCEKKGKVYTVKFAEKSIKAFLLLHVLLHELGHHHDKMTTKNKAESVRGERYAEQYAKKYERSIFNKYFEIFEY